MAVIFARNGMEKTHEQSVQDIGGAGGTIDAGLAMVVIFARNGTIPTF